MKTNILNALKVSTLAIVLSFGLSYALAWTAPSTTPPTGNVSAPINTSATAQVKDGDFTARFLSANSITFPDGTTQTTAGGNFAAANQYTSATTLTIANDGGRLIELGGGGSYTHTLPLVSSGSGGTRISFVAYGGGPFYIAPQGSNCLWLTTGCVGSVTIPSPGHAAVTSNGVNAWIVDSGTPLDGTPSALINWDGGIINQLPNGWITGSNHSGVGWWTMSFNDSFFTASNYPKCVCTGVHSTIAVSCQLTAVVTPTGATVLLRKLSDATGIDSAFYLTCHP